MPSKERSRGRSRTRRASPRRKRAGRAPKMQTKIVGSNQPQLQAMLSKALTPKLSSDGMAFLKCALAPPDFSVDPGKGIPDRFSGRTVTIKDCATTALNFTAGNDTYVVVSPVPGYAYFTASVPIGTTPGTFTGVPYNTYDSNFGPFNSGTVGNDQLTAPTSPSFNKFRYASLAAGIYPTSNMMQFAGSISVWKGDISLCEIAGSADQTTDFTAVPPGITTTRLSDVTVHKLAGTNSISSVVPRDNYTESFIKGAFAISLDNTGDFEWSDFLYDPSYASIEGVISAGPTPPSGTRQSRAVFNGTAAKPLTGWGNNETVIFKISTPAGAVNSATLKVWNCLEMQVNSNSSTYQFSHPSPHMDAAALSAYSMIRNELPVAVPCAQNADFWRRVLSLLRGMFKAASYIPGPVGMVGQGMTALIN